MNVKKRIENMKIYILDNWTDRHKLLGLTRKQLLDLGDNEKLYIIERAIARLRKLGIIVLEKKRYFAFNGHYLKDSNGKYKS